MGLDKTRFASLYIQIWQKRQRSLMGADGFSLSEEVEKWNCNIPACLEYYQALSEQDIRLILES